MLRITRIEFTTVVASFLALAGLVQPVIAQTQTKDSNLRRVELVELEVALPTEVQAEPLDFTSDEKALAGQPVPEAAGKFWIGLRCSIVDGALRAQLGLAEGQGLLVDEVFPDSPAKKAGVQQYDVLLKFGDRELAAVTDLVESVQKTEKKEVEVSLIRAGKPQTLKVTPAERDTAAAETRIAIVVDPDADATQILSLIEKLQKSGPQGEVAWRLLRPGVVLNRRLSTLPKGMSISITKSGDEEAKIVVQRGDQTWEATETTLDKLAEDVRKIVEEFLGQHRTGITGIGVGIGGDLPGGNSRFPITTSRFRNTIRSPSKSPNPAATSGSAGTYGGTEKPGTVPPDRIQTQLEDIQAQLEALRKSVEALQSKKE